MLLEVEAATHYVQLALFLPWALHDSNSEWGYVTAEPRSQELLELPTERQNGRESDPVLVLESSRRVEACFGMKLGCYNVKG